MIPLKQGQSKASAVPAAGRAQMIAVPPIAALSLRVPATEAAAPVTIKALPGEALSTVFDVTLSEVAILYRYLVINTITHTRDGVPLQLGRRSLTYA